VEEEVKQTSFLLSELENKIHKNKYKSGNEWSERKRTNQRPHPTEGNDRQIREPKNKRIRNKGKTEARNRESIKIRPKKKKKKRFRNLMFEQNLVRERENEKEREHKKIPQ